MPCVRVYWEWYSYVYLGSTHFPEALKCFKLENEKLINVSLCELTLYIKMKCPLRMSRVFVETATQMSLQRICTA